MRRPALTTAVVLSSALLLAGCGTASGAPGDAGSGPASQPGPSESVVVDPTGSPSATASPSPTPSSYDGPVLALGDSVMLGAATCMTPLGIKVDAAESRSFYAGADILTARAEADRLPDRVVVHLGTNGPIATADLASLVTALDGHEVYWINVHLPELADYYYADEVNGLLEEQAEMLDNLHVIDWDATAEEHPGWLYSDGTHLTPKGCAGFARMVDDAVRAPLPTP